MANQTTLHNTRQRIGAARQPIYAYELKELDALLATLPPSHPYELEYDERLLMEKNPAYAMGGRGGVATLTPNQSLYRISSAKSVAEGVEDLTLRGVTKRQSAEIIWDKFDQRWRPLSRYARGTLTGRRGIMWWSNLVLEPDTVVRSAYQMGMYNTWIPVYALLLRCSTDYLMEHKSSLVPTVLDAYDQEVFHPTKSADSPTCGITINLETAGKVTKGVEEFVTGPLPVDAIEVFPVYLDSSKRTAYDPVCQGPKCWSLLQKYLKKI